jgi:glycosyltransferase involved in cell wall biosynthesis
MSTRVLFYKHAFSWPFSSGHDVHASNMMRAMSRLGVQVGLVARTEPPAAALEGAGLVFTEYLNAPSARNQSRVSLTRFEERFRSYWGVAEDHIARLGAVASEFQADAVVVVGLDVLPLLGSVTRGVRIWYAADEWFWHHASQVNLTHPESWTELQPAIVKGLYERAYRGRIDRAWVVSDADARAMRWVAGVDAVDVLPNGVDSEWYQPIASPGDRDTATFWGRLDFGPNVQGLQWFCKEVWPAVSRRRPHARFTIIGFNPTAPVQALTSVPGVVLRADVPDVRSEVGRHAVVVLPFVSGGGIKNKLLEAAAMGRPVVATRRAQLGLNGDAPLMIADTREEWVDSLITLWTNPAQRLERGKQLRAWVETNHTWHGVAARALHGLTAAR